MKRAFGLILIIFIIPSSMSCRGTRLFQDSSLDCIEKIIAEIKKAPVQNPPATIWQFIYKGDPVYYIPAPCCDQFNPVYDSNCSLFCYPDGGLTGKGDGKCNDFFLVSKDKKLIWKDPRPNN